MTATHATVGANRLASVSAAAVALVLGALLDLAHLAAYLSGVDIPVGVVVLKIAFAVAALATAAGLWGQRHWAVPLALAVAVLNLLLNTLGVADALMEESASTPDKVVTALGVLIGLAVIALVAPLVRRREMA
jgi:hypothetical protein